MHKTDRVVMTIVSSKR